MSETEIIVRTDNHLKLQGGHYVRDLVRCGVCAYCLIRNNEESYCQEHGFVVPNEWYCADGTKL